MTKLEEIARAICDLDIRQKRKWDTDPAHLEKMLPGAVDYHWRDYEGQASTVLSALTPPKDH